MKLVYISNTRMPHNRAHSIQVAKMVEGFNKQIDATLIVPLKMNSSRSKTYSSYNISSRFKIIYITSIDLIFLNLGILFFYLQSFTFSLSASLYSLFIRKDYYYSRDIFSSFFLCMLRFVHRKKVFYEVHGEPTRFEKLFVNWTLHKLNGIIVLNSYIAELYNGKNKNIFVAHDGVDLNLFSSQHDKKDLRNKLGLPIDKKIVLYSGHLYKWKGIYTLLDSSKHLPGNMSVYVLGGTKNDIEKVKQYMINNKINANLLGYVDYNNVPSYLQAADILVLPNSSRSKFSNIYTSPLKLFEYMAAKNVIVSTNVPSSLEILNESNAILVDADNPKELASGIIKAANSKIAAKLAKKAFEDVANYSWDVRARNILAFMH